jgi:alkanesulfonate monooxygenase SsuD/methylene tetrahydromethanopterin reductase-like flavin-dependent oxidoreductase (luciferase family)
MAQYARVRRACATQGRDPEEVSMSGVLIACCGSSEDEIARRAEAIGLPLAQLYATGATGSPARVVECCRHAQAAGADRLYLQIRDLEDLDHIRLIGEEVLPALR